MHLENRITKQHEDTSPKEAEGNGSLGEDWWTNIEKPKQWRRLEGRTERSARNEGRRKTGGRPTLWPDLRRTEDRRSKG